MIKWLLIFPLIAFGNVDLVKVSEALGHMIGKNLDTFGLDFDLEAVVKGLKDENEGIDSPLTEDECKEAIVHLQDEKIIHTVEDELIRVDSISNSTTDENHPLSTPNPAEYR